MGDRRENEALARRAVDAVVNRDVATLQDCMHPEIVWNETGPTNPLAGRYDGMGEVLSFFARVFEVGGDSFTVEAHDVLASDDHAVLLVHERGQRGSRVLSAPGIYVLHFRDGKVSEGWNYSGDPAAHDEFWA